MKIALSRLSVSSLSWLAYQLILESKTETAYPFLKDHPLLTTLQTTYNRHQIVYGKQSYSGKGKLVAKANLVQNDAFNGMKFCIYGLTKVGGNSLQADAKDLYHLFKDAGISLSRHKYWTKTAELSKLIQKLDKPENKEKIERVHLTEVFEMLKTAFLDFDRLSLEQADANSKLRLMGTASGLRKELENAIHNYLALATAMKEFDGWKKLCGTFNELVKSIRDTNQKSDKNTTEQNPES